MSGKSTQTQKREPWGPSVPAQQKLLDESSKAFDLTNRQPYEGDFLAGPTETQLQGLGQLKSIAPSMSTGAEELRNLGVSTARGDFLNVDSNPYIRQVIEAALKPVTEKYTNNILPGIRDAAIASGAYGGSRQDIQENQAADAYAREAQDTTSKIAYDNYAAERQYQQNAPQLLSAADAFARAPADTLLEAGGLEQGWNQTGLDNEKAKFADSITAPWRGMSDLEAALGPSSAFGTATTETKTNPLTAILQGLMGGASFGGSLATGVGGVAAGAGLRAFAPWMLPFAALGGLAGGLG